MLVPRSSAARGRRPRFLAHLSKHPAGAARGQGVPDKAGSGRGRQAARGRDKQSSHAWRRDGREDETDLGGAGRDARGRGHRGGGGGGSGGARELLGDGGGKASGARSRRWRTETSGEEASRVATREEDLVEAEGLVVDVAKWRI